MANQGPSIDTLLQLVPDHPERVVSELRTHPQLATSQDQNGYSLVHAAASYEQTDLLKLLIEEFKVNPNIKDAFGETCLFNCETVDMAKELINLGVSINTVNDSGQTAAEYLDDEDEAPEVAAYLREVMGEQATGSASIASNLDATAQNTSTQANGVIDEDGTTQPPPPLPDGVQVNIGTMQANEVGEEPDPEFRRRIEALAARQDFQGEEGQRELRNLVEDAISGLGGEGQGPATRRRVE